MHSSITKLHGFVLARRFSILYIFLASLKGSREIERTGLRKVTFRHFEITSCISHIQKDGA
jgi:hypothetical protein